MKILRSYIESGWYNITHNRMYASFYGIGTAITFIFVIILLQIAHLVAGTDVPFVNAPRTVYIESSFEDSQGEYVEGFSIPSARLLLDGIEGVESYSFYNNEWANGIVNDKVRPVSAGFTDGNYFILNQFDFLSGRAFTEEEVNGHKQLAIVTKSFADRYFQGDADNGRLEIQGVEYTVVGVVDDFSSLLNPHEQANVWFPYTFNKFVPSGGSNYSINVLFEKDVPLETIKERMSRALNGYFEDAGKDVTFKPENLLTIQEEKALRLGGSIFAYGVALIVFLLLFIPALNIMTLSMANVQNRAREVALRRSIGASWFESFMQIVVENFMLVLIGLALALVLLHPVTGWIEHVFLSNTGSITVLTDSGLRFQTILYAVLLGVVFSILCGGIPAWVISKKNIASTLKGGES